MSENRSHPVNSSSSSSSSSSSATAAPRSFFATLAAVAWSFIGLRRKSDFDRDVTALNPFYVIGAGLVGVMLFIAVLLSAVAWATR